MKGGGKPENLVALVNDSRSWARQINYYLSIPGGRTKEELFEKKKTAIFRHIAFLYTLKANLRNEKKNDYKKYVSQQDIEKCRRSNKYSQCAIKYTIK